jgi:hypothetical protein
MRGRMLQIPGDGPAAVANGVARRKREARELDRDEESYFSEDVDEDGEVGGWVWQGLVAVDWVQFM